MQVLHSQTQTDATMASEEEHSDEQPTTPVNSDHEQSESGADKADLASSPVAQTPADEDRCDEAIAIVEEAEAIDVPPVVVVDPARSIKEVEQLGPAEEFVDDTLFNRVVKDAASKNDGGTTSDVIATVEVYVCKQCQQEFPYQFRDLKFHRETCTGAPLEEDVRQELEDGVTTPKTKSKKKAVEPAVTTAATSVASGDEGATGSGSPEETRKSEQGNTGRAVGRMKADTKRKRAHKQSPAATDATTTGGGLHDDSFEEFVEDKQHKARCIHCDFVVRCNERSMKGHIRTCPNRAEAVRGHASPSKAPTATDTNSETAEDDTSPPRRSKRLKTEAAIAVPADTKTAFTPRSHPLLVTPHVDGDERHFETIGNDVHAQWMRCRHCGAEVTVREGTLAKHLAGCSSFAARQAAVSELDDYVDELGQQHLDVKSTKKPRRVPETMKLLGDAMALQHGHNGDIGISNLLAVFWVFGSIENADKMKQLYRQAPCMVQAPVSRFRAVAADHLAQLSAAAFLSHLRDGATAALLLNSQLKDVRRTSILDIDPTQASKMYESGFSLQVPAPPAIMSAVVEPLAQDLGLLPVRSFAKQNATVMCYHSGTTMNWQFRRGDVFAVQLSGKVRWSLREGPVKQPVQSYIPQEKSLDEIEELAKVQMATTGFASPVMLMPPSPHAPPSTNETVTDVDDSAGELVLNPGAVLYVPSGTWYEAECLEDGMWIQVELEALTYGDLIADAMKQTFWMGENLRSSVLHSDHRTVQRRLAALLEVAKDNLEILLPGDLIPECVTDAAATVILKQPMDLAHHQFRGSRHLKITEHTMLRQNPLSVLMKVDAIPHSDEVTVPTKPTIQSPTASTKKALKRKQKRSSAPAAKGNSFVVHSGFGGAGMQSKCHATFHCDALQSAVVEWVQARGGRAFQWSDVMDSFHNNDEMLVPQGHTQDEEAVKYVLRYLCSVGFLSVVMP